jgi:hypothetical protein
MEDLVPRKLREVPVEEDEIGFSLESQLQTLAPVVRAEDVVSL